MRIEEAVLRFLERHKTADVLVMDLETGLPVRAEYTTLEGMRRTYPVMYWFEY